MKSEKEFNEDLKNDKPKNKTAKDPLTKKTKAQIVEAYNNLRGEFQNFFQTSRLLRIRVDQIASENESLKEELDETKKNFKTIISFAHKNFVANRMITQYDVSIFYKLIKEINRKKSEDSETRKRKKDQENSQSKKAKPTNPTPPPKTSQKDQNTTPTNPTPPTTTSQKDPNTTPTNPTTLINPIRNRYRLDDLYVQKQVLTRLRQINFQESTTQLMTPKDGNCCIWALKDQAKFNNPTMYLQPKSVTEIRQIVCDYIESSSPEQWSNWFNTAEEIESYLFRMRKDGIYCDDTFLQAFSDKFGIEIDIYPVFNTPHKLNPLGCTTILTRNAMRNGKVYMLYFSEANFVSPHYQSIYPIREKNHFIALDDENRLKKIDSHVKNAKRKLNHDHNLNDGSPPKIQKTLKDKNGNTYGYVGKTKKKVSSKKKGSKPKLRVANNNIIAPDPSGNSTDQEIKDDYTLDIPLMDFDSEAWNSLPLT